MFLASEATDIQQWVWVLVALAVLIVMWGIFADLSERAPREVPSDDWANSTSESAAASSER
jgi:hypothetical protein